MSTTQLRNVVVDKLYGINNEEYLKAIKTIIEMYPDSDTVYKLSEEQRNAIHEGMKQIAQGEFVTNEELEREEDQWLNE